MIIFQRLSVPTQSRWRPAAFDLSSSVLDSLDNYWPPNHTQYKLQNTDNSGSHTVPEGATYYDSLESSTFPQVTQDGKVAGIDSLSFVVGECIKPL